MDEQEILHGFAAYKVGKALLVLGRYGRKRGFADKSFSFTPREVSEALELVSGAQGAENMHSFSLVLTQTVDRLANFVGDFAGGLQFKVSQDWAQQKGFYLPDADLDELVFVPAGLGISVPLLRRDVIETPASAEKLVRDYLLLSKVLSKYVSEHRWLESKMRSLRV
jgi:hypothetical protein